MKKITIAIAQIHIAADRMSSEVERDNLSRVRSALKQAAADDAEVVILPEDFLAGYGYGPGHLPSRLEDDILPQLAELTREFGLYLVGANLNKVETLKSTSTAFIMDPEGKVIGTQDRIHLLDEETQFLIGGKELKVISTPFGKIGLLIGLDLLFPELARELVRQGAECIIVPVLAFSLGKESGEGMDYTKSLFTTACAARALENRVHCIMVNGVGQHIHSGSAIFGGSMVANPVGVQTVLGESEEVRVLNIGPVREECLSILPIDKVGRLVPQPLRLKEIEIDMW